MRCEVCLEMYVHRDKCPNFEKKLEEFDEEESS